MSVIFKAGDHIFSGPTQILTDSVATGDPVDVLQSLEAALKGKLPQKGEQVSVSKESFSFQEYRKAAKSLLQSLVNSISLVVEGFSLRKTVPSQPLQPAGLGWDRVKCLPEELRMIGCEEMFQAFFRHCPETGEFALDFLPETGPDSILRMCFSADEGTEALVATNYVYQCNGLC
eukprot:Skav224484  [mRNA]  locus=scaffold1302:845554:846078:- [translate_table: standard]